MNSRPTFVQSSRLGRVIFQIRDGALFISSRRFGRPIEERVDLRGLTSDYEARVVRLHRLLVIPLVGCLLCAVVMWALWRQTAVPRDALSIFGPSVAIGFGVCLLGAVRGTPSVFFYVFKNQWGKPTLNLIRESKQAAECDAFVAELVAHIELAQSGVSEAERTKILADLEQMTGSPAGRAPAGNKWKYSIGLGLAGVALALFALAGPEPDPSLLILIFPLCLGGMALSYFSFHAREPNRWWSLIGAVLSLVPPFFS